MRPSSEDVRLTLLRHNGHFAGQNGETVLRELRGELSTSVSYSGRTVFELLQNALDRSERRVVIAVQPGTPPMLVVGNDGPGVGVDPDFDYDPQDFEVLKKRSDFHALCSLHTSNKTADESIGNKGVGFRSVFSLGGRVQIWSRLADAADAWWGIEMHSEFTRAVAQERIRADPAVRRGLEWVRDEYLPKQNDRRPRPSFYFPLPLRSDGHPVALPHLDQLETLVVVPLTTPESERQALDTLRELRSTHLCFVGLRAGKEAVDVVACDADGTHRIPVRWSVEDSDLALVAAWKPPLSEAGSHGLAELAAKARHNVSRPGVAIAWPAPQRDEATPRRESLVYGYLPTRVPSPIGCDLHGDFQLEANRTSLNSSANDPVGRYNAALLEAAAELHLVVALRHAGLSDAEIDGFPQGGFRHIDGAATCAFSGAIAPRADLFGLLHPRVDASIQNPFVSHLELLLFGGEHDWDKAARYERWANLASRHFGVDVGEGTTRDAYDCFWLASAAWLARAGATRSVSFGWRHKFMEASAIAFGEAFRHSRARVVPLLEDASALPSAVIRQGFPVPERRERGEGGGRLERRLFVRASEEAKAGDLHLPQVVLDRGRAVTSYPLETVFHQSIDKALGTTAFGRWELLVDLRQLPARVEGWSPTTTIEPDAQLELLQFVAELFSGQLRSSDAPQTFHDRYGWGWRADVDSLPELQGRAGRALSTLYLRTTQGEFEPARQLCLEQVDRAWLATLVERVPALDLDAFLLFLGVSPAPGLLLVEGGETGVVSPCVRPPALLDADGSTRIDLELVVREADNSLQHRLLLAWPQLKLAIDAERAGRRTRIVEALAQRAWVSVEGAGMQMPRGLRAKPTFVAPRDLVLIYRLDRRREVVFSLEVQDSPLRDLLTATGAILGFEDRELERDGAAKALRLLAHLQALDLGAVQSEPLARQAFIELFQNLLDAIARHAPSETRPAVLTYAPSDEELSLGERPLRWTAADEAACIAKDNPDREWARRFFPRVPLVTATLGGEVVQKLPSLGVRAASVVSRVELTASASWSGDTEVRQKLELLLPGLLALAEASRQIPGGIKLDESIDRWRLLQIQRVSNVWYEIELSTGPGAAPLRETWLQDTVSDVVFDEPSRILYDMHDTSDGHPPLRAFAEALARAIPGNPLVAGTFALALSEADADGADADGGDALARFRAHLQKHGAHRLAQTYERELHPLNPEQQQQLRDAIDHGLAALGLQLRPRLADSSMLPGRLGTVDLVLDRLVDRTLAEGQVNEALARVALPAEVARFVPKFSCRAKNRLAWSEWIESERRLDRLLTLAENLAGLSPPVPGAGADVTEVTRRRAASAALDQVLAQCEGLVDFVPVEVAWSWLRDRLGAEHVPFAASELQARLPPLVRYADVSRFLGSEECTWVARKLGPAREIKQELAPQTADERRDEDVLLSAIGADGERALVAWVAATTRGILREHGDAAWRILATGSRRGTRVAAALEDARTAAIDTPGLLERALQVSTFDTGAGYDILGLERDDRGAPRLVRYECKALPSGRIAEVHLTRNEVNVYRRYGSTPELGLWKLTGVRANGTAEDLSKYLEPLRDQTTGPLHALGEHGIGIEGITLRIEQKLS